MPADTCEGKFATDLWTWILSHYTLDAVIAFDPQASPFPGIDTNPLVFFIRNSQPKKNFLWAKCHESSTKSLNLWIRSNFQETSNCSLTILERNLAEGLRIGLSRPPVIEKMSNYTLGDLVQVLRGVATGANDFFFLTEAQAKQLGIPMTYFIQAIGRTRDIIGEEIAQSTLDFLRANGRPTLLLSLNIGTFETYPESVKNYLALGEKMGLPGRPLLSQRKPWYKMESRIAPPFLFAYLGRRNARFIRNTAKVVPLTCFLCVYPNSNAPEYLDRLWKILKHPSTMANLPMIGKSYGDGAIKVEPRSLEKLPIPNDVIEQVGLPTQPRLMEQQEFLLTDI